MNSPQGKSQNNNNSNIMQSFSLNSSGKVDLSKLDASEETMSHYTYPKEFLKLDLDKIREFIEILEEHYQNLIEQEDLSKAKSAKQRLILLKNLEKEKMKKEAKIIYSNQRELVQDKMNEELNNYLNTASKEFDSLLQAFESQEVEMLKAQKQEMDALVKNFYQIYENKKPRPSKEILNLIKIRNYAVKQNKFDKVEEVNKEINKLKIKDDQNFAKEKEKKLKAEINKLNHKHENEKNALQMKKNSLIDLFNQTKNKNVEQIQKKFEAKMKELKNYQSFEMSNFDKITKGIAKPSSRIQNIVSSTTGVKEEEDNIENEENAEEQNNNNEIENEEQVNEDKKIENNNEKENIEQVNDEKEQENNDGEEEQNLEQNENNENYENDIGEEMEGEGGVEGEGEGEGEEEENNNIINDNEEEDKNNIQI